jgi:hypothetical protein
VSKVIPLSDIDTRAEQAFQLRLNGVSVKRIAKALGMTEGEAQRAIEASCTPISEHMRKHSLELELHRLDRMEEIYSSGMKDQNTAVGHLLLKIREFRSDLLGTRAPVRIDAVQVVKAAEGNTTERIQRVLDDLAGRAEDKPNEPDEPAA